MPNLTESEIQRVRHAINDMDREIRQLRQQVRTMEPICDAYQALTKVIRMIPSDNREMVMGRDMLFEAAKLSDMLDSKLAKPDPDGETSGTSV